jgi:serpin B
MGYEPEPAERPYTPTPPEELLARAKRRGAATRRRRRLLTSSTSVTLVVAAVLIGILVPGGSAPGRHFSTRPPLPGPVRVAARIGSAYELTADNWRSRIATPKLARALQDDEIGYSISLLRTLAGSAGSGNVLVSPSSLATALAMLELGARGSTEQGIAAALDSTGLTASDQAAGWHALAAILAAETSTGAASLKQEPELDIANALFLQKQFSVLPSFVGALTSEFQTGLWRVDFAHDLPGATDAINQWTSEHTMGLIKQLFSPGALTTATVLVLADAVYFHADWAQSFESSTRGEPFYPSTGAVENVPFMRSSPVDSKHALTVPVSVTSGYDAVELPYAGRKLSALAVMPVGSSLAQFVSSLTPAGLSKIVSGLNTRAVELSMPTFKLRADDQLKETLSTMGMSQAFGSGADFTNITAQPPLQVASVEQRAYLQVTPKGTTAAAATGVNVIMSAIAGGDRPVVLNHPFLFLIRDNTTGAILFESMIENPAS